MYTIILESLQDSIELPARNLSFSTETSVMQLWDAEGSMYALPAPTKTRIEITFDHAVETLDKLSGFYEMPRASTMLIRRGETAITSVENVHMESMTWGLHHNVEDGLTNDLEVIFSFFGRAPNWHHAAPKEELQKLDWMKLGF